MELNKKNLMSLVISSASVLTVGLLFFAPIDKFTFPGSMVSYQENVSQLKDANNTSTQSFKRLDSLKVAAAEKDAELKVVDSASEKSSEMFDQLLNEQEKSGSWSYHIPSLLIKLENFGDVTNTKVAIDYTTIKSEGEFVSESKKGLKYVKVKVEVYGDYNDVTDYMRKVENIDFISVNKLSMNLVENGDVASKFYMNVYYMP